MATSGEQARFVRSLFRRMLKLARSIPQEEKRASALAKIRSGFRENASRTDTAIVSSLLDEAQKSLGYLRVVSPYRERNTAAAASFASSATSPGEAAHLQRAEGVPRAQGAEAEAEAEAEGTGEGEEVGQAGKGTAAAGSGDSGTRQSGKTRYVFVDGKLTEVGTGGAEGNKRSFTARKSKAYEVTNEDLRRHQRLVNRQYFGGRR